MAEHIGVRVAFACWNLAGTQVAMASDVTLRFARQEQGKEPMGFIELAPEVSCLDLRPSQAQGRLGNVVQCPAGSVSVGC